MLKIISDHDEISKVQRLFKDKFKPFITEKIQGKVGHIGHSWEEELLWCKDYDMWVSFGTVEENNRYWNGFGIGRPIESSNRIVTEINIPKKGINRTIGGAFAMDEQEQPILVHRGKIGGGRKNIGKGTFVDNYRGEFIDIIDGDRETEVALIGALKHPNFIKQISVFVHEIDRIKELATHNVTRKKISQPHPRHSQEFRGTKKYDVNRTITAKCNHGIIVKDLDDEIKKRGLVTYNDILRDLYIVDNQNKITTVFEIKTDTSTTSFYSGVGQLLINNVDLPQKPRLILVVPEHEDNSLVSTFKKIDIELLTFKWRNNDVVFPGLNFMRF